MVIGAGKVNNGVMSFFCADGTGFQSNVSSKREMLSDKEVVRYQASKHSDVSVPDFMMKRSEKRQHKSLNDDLYAETTRRQVQLVGQEQTKEESVMTRVVRWFFS